MAKQEISDSVHAPSTIPKYRNTFTSFVEPEPGKKLWETKHIEYQPEGYAEEEVARLDYFGMAKLFQEEQPREGPTTKSAEMALRGVRIPDLTTVELWKIIGSERPVAIRAKAFTELMYRESERSGLAPFVVEELARDDLKPTWRNTLIFATEHLDFLDAGQRQRLRDLLGGLVTALAEEWHPRSRLAQEAALRRYGSLIDNKVNLGEIVRFLGTDYPLRVRLIGLQTIQNAFATAPPSASLRNELEPLRDELQRMVQFFFRPKTLARSEEDFDVGLTALEALIRLGDPIVSQFMPCVKEIARSWVVKQLERFLSETLTAWGSASASDPARAVRDALDMLETVASGRDR